MTRYPWSLIGTIIISGCSSSDDSRCAVPVNNSCITEDKFCDPTGACQSCPLGTVNCDGANENACEVTASTCSAVSCSDCEPPSCCDEGFCRGPEQVCSNGGRCLDGACTEPTICPGCSAPRCCDNGVCREPNDTCDNGGTCENGGCTLGPCDTCDPPRCCDELVCREQGERCADGTICTAGQCYDRCDLCIFPYCCDEGNCLTEGQRCASGGSCLDGSCGAASCTEVGKWSGDGTGSYDAANNASIIDVLSPNAAILHLELFHDRATAPRLLDYEGQSRSDCETVGVCAMLGLECGEAFSSCKARYLALAATIDVLAADALATGTMTATIADALFVEWDVSADRAAADWECIELDAAELSASW